MGTIVVATVGPAILLSAAFSLGACRGGFLFSGVSAVFVSVAAAAVCLVVTPVTALVLRLRRSHFGWGTLLGVVSVCAFIAVAALSYFDTRQTMRILMTGSPVPGGLRVHRGSSGLFRGYVRFSGPPGVLASLMHSKGLKEVPAEPTEPSVLTGFGAREQSKTPWGWWNPTSMPGARFYFRHHTTEAGEAWTEGWWVSGATNEVFAFFGG